MKPIIYNVIILLAASQATAMNAHAQTDDYRTQMEAMVLKHLQATDGAERQQALDAMDKLDKQFKGNFVRKTWKALDEKTATAADYRRVGIMMAAAGEKEACKWCFRKGAQLGEPYCANLTLIDQLKELQNTDAANFLLPLLNGWTLPLLHNMALALFIHNTPESVETARELAQTFFTMSDDKQYRYNVYDYSEYIDYRDEPQRRQLNMCWFNCLGSIQIGKTLRQLYEASKQE